MVEAGKVTLRVEVDAREFREFMRKTPAEMTAMEKKLASATTATEKLGTTATTTAVRFQTLTQGAINLTNSFTQAYTSISNLQKAKTSLQAAAVGVERAIDLQRRKQYQLNQEMKKATPDYAKIELLTRELETAHDDLAVKQQRVKDQTEQVKDVYRLFALNIANVGFSAIQTGVSMVKMAEGTKIAAAAGKLLNLSMGKWALIATGIIVLYEGLAQGIKYFNKELGESMSIIDNTNKLMAEWGSSTDITLDHYEDKIGSANDATREFENQWKSMTNTVKKETSMQEELITHWRRTYENELEKMAIAQKKIVIPTASGGGSQGNFNEAQSGKIPINSAKAVAGSWVVLDIYTKLENLVHNLFPNMPEANAEQMLTNQVTGQLKANNYKLTVGGDEYKQAPSLSTFMTGVQMRGIEKKVPGSFPWLPKSPFEPLLKDQDQSMIDFIQNQIDKDNLTYQKLSKRYQEAYTRFNSLDPETTDPGNYNRWADQLMKWSDELYDLETRMLKNQVKIDDILVKPQRVVKQQDKVEQSGFKTKQLTQRQKHREELARRQRKGIHTTTKYFGSRNSMYDSGFGVHWATSTNLHGYSNVANTMAIRGSGAMGGRAVTYGGIGGNILVNAIIAGQEFGHGSSVIQQLIQAQTLGLGDPTRRRYGFDRPQRRTNVDFQKMYLTMYEIDQTARALPEIINRINSAKAEGNISQLIAMGAVSSVPEYLGTQKIPDHIRFGQDAIARGQVSMSAQWANPNFALGSGGYMRPRVDSRFAEERKNRDVFARGIGVVYQNAINRFFGSGRTQTLGRSASRAARNLNLNSSYMDMAKTLGIFDDPNFAERLLQMDNNINASETDAVNKANNLYHTVNQASREYLSLQQRTLANVGIDIDLSNVRTFSHWQGFAGGKRHAIYDYYTPAEMAADMIADMGAQGLGLNISMDRGFLNNMALLAKYNTTNFNNTAILDASISRLNISRKQAFDIRLDYKRGDNELRDRLRWRQRLDGMSTGNVVI